MPDDYLVMLSTDTFYLQQYLHQFFNKNEWWVKRQQARVEKITEAWSKRSSISSMFCFTIKICTLLSTSDRVSSPVSSLQKALFGAPRTNATVIPPLKEMVHWKQHTYQQTTHDGNPNNFSYWEITNWGAEINTPPRSNNTAFIITGPLSKFLNECFLLRCNSGISPVRSPCP